MNWPSMMEKSSLSHPYRQKRYDPARLNTQYDRGDTTDLLFSALTHWKSVRAEKKIWAVKPMT